MWPHREQPTRLPRPWDSPGKNTGVGCHFLLQCMSAVTSKFLVATVLHIERNMPCFYRWLPQSFRGLGGSYFESLSLFISSVQLLSPVRLFATPCTAAHQTFLSITNSRSLLKLVFIELVMPSNHLILCCPLILLPSIFPSIRVFSDESALRIRWSKYWNFSFNISPSKEYSGLISFRMDWLDLLAVQGALKNLLQNYSSRTSILWCLAFFIAQLSHPYMTTGKTIALTRQTFVGKVMSLLFNMLSRLVITFLPRRSIF